MRPEDKFFQGDIEGPRCGICGSRSCLCFGFCSGTDTCRSCEPEECHRADRSLYAEVCEYDECYCVCHNFDPVYRYNVEDDDSSEIDDPSESDDYCKCHKVDSGMQPAAQEKQPMRAVKGPFTFLALPKEIRFEIYRLVIHQHGNGQHNPYFRGSTDTALLYTCRQIYQEVRHLPLTLTKLNFYDTLSALEFFACKIPVSVREYVNNVEIRVYMDQANFGQWNMLIPLLEKTGIKHLCLTFLNDNQDHREAAVTRFVCGTPRFKPFKTLRSIKLGTYPGQFTEEERKKIEKIVKMKFIDGYKASRTRGKQSASSRKNQQSSKPVLKKVSFIHTMLSTLVDVD